MHTLAGGPATAAILDASSLEQAAHSANAVTGLCAQLPDTLARLVFLNKETAQSFLFLWRDSLTASEFRNRSHDALGPLGLKRITVPASKSRARVPPIDRPYLVATCRRVNPCS